MNLVCVSVDIYTSKCGVSQSRAFFCLFTFTVTRPLKKNCKVFTNMILLSLWGERCRLEAHVMSQKSMDECDEDERLEFAHDLKSEEAGTEHMKKLYSGGVQKRWEDFLSGNEHTLCGLIQGYDDLDNEHAILCPVWSGNCDSGIPKVVLLEDAPKLAKEMAKEYTEGDNTVLGGRNQVVSVMFKFQERKLLCVFPNSWFVVCSARFGAMNYPTRNGWTLGMILSGWSWLSQTSCTQKWIGRIDQIGRGGWEGNGEGEKGIPFHLVCNTNTPLNEKLNPSLSIMQSKFPKHCKYIINFLIF